MEHELYEGDESWDYGEGRGKGKYEDGEMMDLFLTIRLHSRTFCLERRCKLQLTHVYMYTTHCTENSNTYCARSKWCTSCRHEPRHSEINSLVLK